MRSVITLSDLTGTSTAEFLRFGLVGFATNGVAYSIYVVLTAFGAAPLPAVAITYAYGILQSFHFNRVWSYRYDSPSAPALLRYCITYVWCYVLNSSVLVVSVDVLGFDHKVVQAVYIVFAGVALYFIQKFWVFTRTLKNI